MPDYSVEVRGWVDVTCDTHEEAMAEVAASMWNDIQNIEVVAASELTEDAAGHLIGGMPVYMGERA